MVSVSEASAIVESHLYRPFTQEVSINEASGRVLDEPIHADRDFPPFDRVAMDGIAINDQQFQSGLRKFSIENLASAGDPQTELTSIQNCIEVMTGACLPKNANAVIRYEDIEISDGFATIKITSVEPWQNIHTKGSDAKVNEQLLKPGVRLSPAEIALLATVGKHRVKVKSCPRFAIVSTGNELVDIHQTPLSHQIRRSNVYVVLSALSELHCQAQLFHLPDREEVIQSELKAIIENYDVIILSGGVSKGKFDHVPAALEKLGVKKHFHRVSQKPGKPFWFGTLNYKTFFALPGNPVSTYLCFYRYVKPWLSKSLGIETKNFYAQLNQDFTFRADLTYYLQVSIANHEGVLVAHPVEGGGSGDLGNLKDVDGFIELPSQESTFKKGAAYPVFLFRQI